LGEEVKEEIPAATILDVLSRYFTRRDLIWEYIAKTDKEILEWLKAVAKAWGISPIVIPPVVIPAAPIPAPLIPAAPVPPISVIPQPEGRITKQGSITTSSTFQVICDYSPSSEKRFHLTKIAISCSEDVVAQVFWKGNQEITIPYTVMGKLPFTDWFPFNYWEDDITKKIAGDGTSKIELKAKYPSGGAAATCDGQFVGEEV